MEEGDLIIKKWFAWYPVFTENSGWVWFKTVYKKIDYRPLKHLGLHEEVTFIKIN